MEKECGTANGEHVSRAMTMVKKAIVSRCKRAVGCESSS
jgi:hypothetical protein